MGSTTLLQGPTTSQENNVRMADFNSTLYDNELEFFKIVTAGTVWLTFTPQQVMGTTYSVSGVLSKSHKVTVHVKFPSGDECAYTYRTPQRRSGSECQ